MTTEEKLELAIETLKIYANPSNWYKESGSDAEVLFWYEDSEMDGYTPAQKCLRKVTK